MIELTNWSFTQQPDDPYLALELKTLHAQGNCSNHPRLEDGYVTTSAIDTAEGRVLTTKSGSKYILVGDPDPEYVAFLKSIGRTMDPFNPVTFIGS